MGMVILSVFELKGACPTSDAWAYAHVENGCVQHSQSVGILRQIGFLLKELCLFVLPDYQVAFWKLVVSQACYTKYST